MPRIETISSPRLPHLAGIDEKPQAHARSEDCDGKRSSAFRMMAVLPPSAGFARSETPGLNLSSAFPFAAVSTAAGLIVSAPMNT